MRTGNGLIMTRLRAYFRNGPWRGVVFLAFSIFYILYQSVSYMYSVASPVIPNPPLPPDGKHYRPKIIYDLSHYNSSEEKDFYVGNCLITRNPALSVAADAVAITWRKHIRPSSIISSVRPFWQRWVWIMDESPFHIGENLAAADGVFNWTMTYRQDSDIYIPNGVYKQRKKPEPIPRHIGSQKQLISAVISNNNREYVHNGRYDFVMKLKKYIPVTIFGAAGEPCEGYSQAKQQLSKLCPVIKNYLFYLALENSNCKEYLTEKVFGNAFSTGSVPVVLGASKEDYLKALPPSSFIHVRDFPSVEMLARHLLFLANNKTEYMKYHKWRENYETSYRIQYKVGRIWEPLCDALNKDNGVQSIRNISGWWTLNDCEKHTDSYEHVYQNTHLGRDIGQLHSNRH